MFFLEFPFKTYPNKERQAFLTLKDKPDIFKACHLVALSITF